MWQMMTFLNPLDALTPKIPFSCFANFWVWVTSEARGSVLVGFWGSRQLSPFWGGGGGLPRGLYRPPPPIESLPALLFAVPIVCVFVCVCVCVKPNVQYLVPYQHHLIFFALCIPSIPGVLGVHHLIMAQPPLTSHKRYAHTRSAIVPSFCAVDFGHQLCCFQEILCGHWRTTLVE